MLGEWVARCKPSSACFPAARKSLDSLRLRDPRGSRSVGDKLSFCREFSSRIWVRREAAFAVGGDPEGPAFRASSLPERDLRRYIVRYNFCTPKIYRQYYHRR